MARPFAKFSEGEIEEAFFYPCDLVNTKTTIPLRVGEEQWIYSYFEKGCRKKVHATILKGIVSDFKCTVFQRNLKESYGRPLIYVCEC